MTGFITTDELEGMWRPLSGAEKQLGGLVIEAASTWIRDKKPGIDDANEAARLVVFEITKAVLLPGEWAGYSQWSVTVGGRTRSGTLSDAAAMVSFTPWQLMLLGISTTAQPSWNFPKDDY
ncbi:hypothetical protein [Gordonia sp. SND2]|uniref:hypothetical protein n=1 Tax=Gordonia sp. SND2 TaxID=3388659 RepID=UPI00398ABA38